MYVYVNAGNARIFLGMVGPFIRLLVPDAPSAVRGDHILGCSNTLDTFLPTLDFFSQVP